MRAGDVFRFTGIAEKHVWTIISDPAQDVVRVLMVNFTSHMPHLDQACCIQPGEHAFIKHASLVNYARARVVTDAALEALRASGRLELLNPPSPELLSRIREGAGRSCTLKLEFADILMEQELID